MPPGLRIRRDPDRGDAGGQNQKEAFDIYDAPEAEDVVCVGEPVATGATKPRSEVHRDGDWHRSVDIWIIDGDDVLIQRRSKLKDTNPGKLDVSCAGHLGAGQSPVDAALRELNEELGIVVDDLKFAFRAPCVATGASYLDKEFIDVFLLRLPIRDVHFTIATSEVDDLLVMPLPSVLQDLRDGSSFVPKPEHYLDALVDAISSLPDLSV